MRMRSSADSARRSPGLFLRVFRLTVLFLPVILLLVLSLRVPEEIQQLLWLGTAIQLLLSGAGLWWIGQAGRESVGPAVIMLYIVALAWGFFAAFHREDVIRQDPITYLTQAVLLVVPLVYFAIQCLRDSGATSIRQARQLAARLAARQDWPRDLMKIRDLPEVKALREALHVDAAPALEMLTTTNPAVRVAALSALEFRPTWRPGQPQLILQLAERAPEPEVRACAINALGNLEDRNLLESLAQLLRDPSSLVRQTATEALLWNTENRWLWLRDSVRQALADPELESDGPLKLGENVLLTREALADFQAWSAEKGIVSVRAALTLGAYYNQQLTAGMTPELLKELRQQLRHPQTPPMLRLELARLMYHHHELNESDLRRMLEPTMPAPVRLIAVETLLALGPNPEAMAALHDLARLPNREIALMTAQVVQRRLNIDLGLPRDQAPPPIQSRTAAEVARRVLGWAMQYEANEAAAAALAPSSGSQPAYQRSSGGESSDRVELG